VLTSIVTAIAGIAAALGKLADAAAGFVALKQAEWQQELGQLRQEAVLLRSENESLKTRLAAVMAASGRPGADRL
jgi:hypothetical protein